MNKKTNIFGKILMVGIIIFFYLPIIYMIIFSFNDGKSLTTFTGFSLRWYEHMLGPSKQFPADESGNCNRDWFYASLHYIPD